MSSISDVGAITDIADGAKAGVASALAQIRTAKVQTENQLAAVDNIMKGIGSQPQLPGLPSSNDIAAQSQVVLQQGAAKLDEFNDLAGLGGSCLDGALGNINSIASDGVGFMADALGAFQNTAGMPSEMMDIYGRYSEIREFTSNLGIDKLVAGITGTFGCLGDSTFITEVTGELNQLMFELGMDSNGNVTDTDYNAKMLSELQASAANYGIDTSFATTMAEGLGDMSTVANDLSVQAKDTANQAIADAKQAIKDNVPKSVIPSRFF